MPIQEFILHSVLRKYEISELRRIFGPQREEVAWGGGGAGDDVIKRRLIKYY
jgi:hypothetical protein